MSSSDLARLLSLPSELLHEIIQMCSHKERCNLRATCHILKDHTDPLVFYRLVLHSRDTHIWKHQIIALALSSRSSPACEFTRELEIRYIPDLQETEHSWYRFVHLAVSSLRNVTCFRWYKIRDYPALLFDELMQAVVRLPRLTELDVVITLFCRALIPFALFSNLSKLSVRYGRNVSEDNSSLISQMATVVTNSPQLKCLDVIYDKSLAYGHFKLSHLFANLSAKNPLCLEQLRISQVDATVDRVMLPHLSQLTSFRYNMFKDFPVAQSIWTSFLVNNVNLSDMTISGLISNETMLYLSSLSGLKRLVVYDIVFVNMTEETLEETFFAEVLPKNINSLQELGMRVSELTNLKSITRCLKLRRLDVCVRNIPVQQLLDTVAHLPELRKLRIYSMFQSDNFADFKPTKGLRYVEELEMNNVPFILEREGEGPVRYRQIY